MTDIMNPSDPGNLCPADTLVLHPCYGPVCERCTDPADRHDFKDRSCVGCGWCPGYQRAKGPHEHHWDRYRAEEIGLPPGSPDTLHCPECDRTRATPREAKL